MAKIPYPRRIILQKRARQLLDEGNDEGAAVTIMVSEELCTEPIARGVVQWIIAYNWPSPQSKARMKKTLNE